MLKKLSLLLATLLAATSLQAQDSSDYDLSLKYGLTSLDNDDGWELENHTFAADMTFDLGYALKPRVDFTYISVDDEEKWGDVSSLMQFAINGKYGRTFDMGGLPHELYLLGGIGYEYVVDGHETFDSLPFFQAGFGAKYGITESVNLVAELKGLQVFDGNNDSDDEDNEFSLLVGLNFPFGVETKKPAVKLKTLDSDFDGVADKIDLCPNSVRGTKVDLSGCAVQKVVAAEPVPEVVKRVILLDSDNDTITDDIDKCPDTPLGAKVDGSGCMEKLNLEINFESNSAEMKVDSLPKVKAFADFLKKSPEGTVAIIEGHTDSSGNAEKNRALSSKRAFAVRKALIAEGLAKNTVRAYGRGSEHPIADNATVEGRAQNRRIEATIKHKGEI